MQERIVHSAWGIVLNAKGESILLTKKVSRHELIAIAKISLRKLLGTSPETTIKKLKWWFTKGKIEEWETKEMAARKEIEEEWGIDQNDLILLGYLGSFTKPKRYGRKEIDMFLYIIEKEYQKLTPTDSRHIAAFIHKKKIVKKIENSEERKFLESKLEAIEEAIIAYTTPKNLPLNTQKYVFEIDTWDVR